MNLRKRNKGTVEVHTSALNDIMFFLLLFFLLASAVVNPEVVKLLLPKSDSGQQSSAQKTVTVSIDENLNYFIDKQPTTLENLQSTLEAYKATAPDLSIVLYAAGTVSIENTLVVYDIASKLNLKLVLAVEPKK
ncbi:ExbD/TolR family protein [Pedobacter psychroterrae]|uniref:Biopolymer transporter ExbD n=1 Tax=Pedobacter psychroterrae TaxID=2530453 RepID=A0A4R0NH43_9SPHI|nr:biopolymer transporter ExbD [Pedobacter psychroterrae]TCC99067.1 biopolymer transporter ExbD [Pedobacter psychroterrae]